MRKWKRWLLITGSTLIGLGILYVVFSFRFLDFFVDLWWFRSLNYEGYFLQRLFYRYLIVASVTLVFFLIFFLNFWLASRYLGTAIPEGSQTKGSAKKRYLDLLKKFQSGSLKIYTPLSLILAVPIAIPFYEQWEKALLYIFSPHTGTTDPVYGKDIAYYLFSFPVYTLVQQKLVIVFLLLFFALLLLYWTESHLLSKENQQLPRGAKIHLTILFLIITCVQAWGFVLERYALLYTNTHMPLFFGPGFMEIRFALPFIWFTLLSFMGLAVSLIFLIHKKKAVKISVFFSICFLLALWGRNASFFPKMIEKYIVKPNEPVREKPFIAANIKATLAAYNLEKVETRKYQVANGYEIISNSDVKKSLRNVPTWDREFLDDVYKQLQGIRPYYSFPDVDVDRYDVGGNSQQVYLAARELNIEALTGSGKNWVNTHLQYTHGYGIVMTPSAQDGDEPMTWFIQDIPPKSDYGINVTQPRIYYGTGNYEYIIAPNDNGEIDYSQEETNVMVNYEGKGGIPMSSLFKKLLFATYFEDRNIFLTTKTNEKSRILFRRNITTIIETLTPYFLLDEDPYIVTTDKGLFWIQDAYTISDTYPNAHPYDKESNYIRNSVKIVIDAYNGDVNYYIADPKDPFILAYDRIYPGLLKNMDKMPSELKKHLRYPKDIFKIQMDLYAKYHQIDPDTFYRQEDNWKTAQMIKNDQSIPMEPYYLTLNLLDPETHEFLLLNPMSPVGRDNLRSLAIAGCDGENYGKIVVYSFPKGEQVYGPSQISSLIDQDTDIAQELTLWDQRGSEVKRGRIIILPIGNLMLYIQPIYISSATRLKIPELKRLIVSQGDLVTMDASLETACQKLENNLKERIERRKGRFSVLNSQTEPPREPETPTGQEQKEPIKDVMVEQP